MLILTRKGSAMKKVYKKDKQVCTHVPKVMGEKKSHAIYLLGLIKIF